MWEAVDPDGRLVVLTFERWRHIVERHPELVELRDSILDAVAAPLVRRAGHDTNEEWFYASIHGPPTRFVRVVVLFREGSGRITTAFSAEASPMPVTIAGIEFDNVFYDREVDVLYLHVGDPASAVDWDDSDEGDGIRYGRDGGLIGLTILNARRRLERDGKLVITLHGRQIETSDLDNVLAPA